MTNIGSNITLYICMYVYIYIYMYKGTIRSQGVGGLNIRVMKEGSEPMSSAYSPGSQFHFPLDVRLNPNPQPWTQKIEASTFLSIITI